MRFAAALSEHPVTAHATGEVIGQVLDGLGSAPGAGPGVVEPDLALIFVTAAHAGALEDAANAVQTTLRPRVVLGCGAESVAGPGREVEGKAAVALWAASGLAAEGIRLDDAEAPGWPPESASVDPGVLVLLGDPFSFDAETFFSGLARAGPPLPVVGGMASAAAGPGGNRLVLGGTARERLMVVDRGAVGAVLDRTAPVETVVSQGCRPVGRPWAVTRTEGNVVYELAGRPALERLMEMAERDLSPEEVAIVNAGGLHIGRVIDEHQTTFGRGDFLVRNVLGADRSAGAVAVNDVYELGTTVQFHLRDAASADEDLKALMAGRRAEAALMFTCNGRGTRLFRRAHHDASVIGDALGGVPLAGLFAAGEFGPVGGRNFLHGFTASVALFGGHPAG